MQSSAMKSSKGIESNVSAEGVNHKCGSGRDANHLYKKPEHDSDSTINKGVDDEDNTLESHAMNADSEDDVKSRSSAKGGKSMKESDYDLPDLPSCHGSESDDDFLYATMGQSSLNVTPKPPSEEDEEKVRPTLDLCVIEDQNFTADRLVHMKDMSKCPRGGQHLNSLYAKFTSTSAKNMHVVTTTNVPEPIRGHLVHSLRSMTWAALHIFKIPQKSTNKRITLVGDALGLCFPDGYSYLFTCSKLVSNLIWIAQNCSTCTFVGLDLQRDIWELFKEARHKTVDKAVKSMKVVDVRYLWKTLGVEIPFNHIRLPEGGVDWYAFIFRFADIFFEHKISPNLSTRCEKILQLHRTSVLCNEGDKDSKCRFHARKVKTTYKTYMVEFLTLEMALPLLMFAAVSRRHATTGDDLTDMEDCMTRFEYFLNRQTQRYKSDMDDLSQKKGSRRFSSASTSSSGDLKKKRQEVTGITPLTKSSKPKWKPPRMPFKRRCVGKGKEAMATTSTTNPHGSEDDGQDTFTESRDDERVDGTVVASRVREK